MRRHIVAGGLLALSCTAAAAGTGPCKPDRFDGLTCGEGPGAARVIAGTISPSKEFAFAWRDPGRPPTDEPDIDQVESVLLWLHNGTAMAIAPGAYWDTGTAHVNRYDFHAIWSPDSRYVIELLDFRWSTEALRLHALAEHGRSVRSIDLKPIVETAVRKQLRKTMKNEAVYALEIEGDNSGEPPVLTIDNRGLIKTRIEMQVPKGDDPVIHVDAAFQVSDRDGALEVRALSIRRVKDAD
ncbi:MAG TPA: hypothetical protein VFB31_08415 [Pseudolabrys sp.]|nr:hypothetical protein [Pseudolabrys sp.]